MGRINVSEFGLLQKFIAVTYLYISTAVLIIEIDGMVMYVAVSPELVRKTSSPLNIPEKHYFGIVIRGTGNASRPCLIGLYAFVPSNLFR